jgi:equilibrative nucleoside transporter 1/2/3
MGNNRKPLQHSLFFKKSYLLALALFFCFIITTLSPVFASKIQSVKLPMAEFSISQPTIFIGTAFLTWNIGELLGSFVPLLPFTSLKRPEIIFGVSVSRIGFIVLYNVCNLNGRGAVVGGDIFYLVVVQGLSGLTSGWVATAAMIGASQWETEAERQKAGTFMVLYLIAGLAAGGFLSFTIT